MHHGIGVLLLVVGCLFVAAHGANAADAAFRTADLVTASGVDPEVLAAGEEPTWSEGRDETASVEAIALAQVTSCESACASKHMQCLGWCMRGTAFPSGCERRCGETYEACLAGC